MELCFLFLGNVASHWISLMSGIVSVIVAIYETIKNKPIVARWFWIVALVCFVVACEKAWQDEHRNTQVVVGEKAAYASAAEHCQTDAKIREAFTQGLELNGLTSRQTIDRQQRLNDKQASDVSECLLAVDKSLPSLIETINVFTIPAGRKDTNVGIHSEESPANYLYSYLLIFSTNIEEQRFQGSLECDVPFEFTSPPMFTPITDKSRNFKSQEMHSKAGTRYYPLDMAALDEHWDSIHPVVVHTVSRFSFLLCKFNH